MAQIISAQASPQAQTKMPAQHYFSARPIPINPPPEHVFLAQVAGRTKHTRNVSPDLSDSITPNPGYLHLRPCRGDLGTSPSQRAISFSSWTKNSPSAPCSPSGSLKASVRCGASGITQDFDPPKNEWTFLGADQPVYTGKPFVRPGLHRRNTHFGSSSTLSSMTLADDQYDVITFTKQPLKRASTSSQLTASIKGVSLESIRGGASAVKRLGQEGMTCEDLPSAFDDSEDEED